MPRSMTAGEWNAAHPVGTVVIVTRDDKSELRTKTRSEAWELGHGQPVVMVDGIRGGYALERVRPAPPAELCEHKSFKSKVGVGRLSHTEGGPITGYTADITITCADCGLPFRFIGLTSGSHHSEPRVSVDGLELRAPLEPATHEKFAPVANYTIPPRARH